MENCICQIVKDNGEKGTGFFCSIPFPDENNLLKVLITNNHILNENDIKNGKIIKFKMHNREKKKEEEKEIRIDNSRKVLTIKKVEEGIDITIIEIKQKDNIYAFLGIDDKILELDCIRKSIYILHYPRDKRLVSYGLMKSISTGKKISHYCNTEYGSSGSPILSLNNFKVIGVHYGGSENRNIKLNFGTFIKYAIKEFYNKYKSDIVTKNEILHNQIFGNEFVKNNVNNFQMINYNNYELNSFYKIKNEKENINIRKKNEFYPSVNNNPISNESSETENIKYFGQEKKIKKQIIKVVFNDNINKCEIYTDPETTMGELINIYYAKNNIKAKNKLFFSNGEILLVESINKKIKEFNIHNGVNEVFIFVSEIIN